MKWTVKTGDILNESAEVLICSANIFLNLSGGIGGAILLRCGDGMQRELHDYLSRTGKRHLEPGSVVITSSHGLTFKSVIHAVAVDGFYESSPEVIAKTVTNALKAAATLGAKTVALTALATGFGRVPMATFARALSSLSRAEFGSVDEVIVCVKNKDDARTLEQSLH